MLSTRLPRVILLALALIGVAGVWPIAYGQITGATQCPALGPVPACYVVFVAYGLIAASALMPRYRFAMFAAGWLPLFALASTGMSLELLGNTVCPRSNAGIPTCFLSFALLLAIAVAYIVETLMRRRLTAASE